MDYANAVTLGKVSSTYEQDLKGMHMLVRPVYGKKTDPDNPPIASIDTTAAGKAAQSVHLGLSVKWATYNLEPQRLQTRAAIFNGHVLRLAQTSLEVPINGTMPTREA